MSIKSQVFGCDLTNKKPDESVFGMYGWKSDLGDEEILEMGK